MLFHTQCAGCGEPGPVLCHRCRFALAATPRSSRGDFSGAVLDDVVSALPYAELTRSLVHALKFRNGKRLAPELAQALARRLRASGVVPGSLDVVTWAPTSNSRRDRRGYDQAELVARALARLLGVRARRLLHRTHGDAQTGRTRADRLAGPTFRAHPSVTGKRVLVVDDVVTTGATLHAARQTLCAAGAAQICLAAVAAVPAVTTGRPVRRPVRLTSTLQPVPNVSMAS